MLHLDEYLYQNRPEAYPPDVKGVWHTTTFEAFAKKYLQFLDPIFTDTYVVFNVPNMDREHEGEKIEVKVPLYEKVGLRWDGRGVSLDEDPFGNGFITFDLVFDGPWKYQYYDLTCAISEVYANSRIPQEQVVLTAPEPIIHWPVQPGIQSENFERIQGVYMFLSEAKPLRDRFLLALEERFTVKQF